MTRKSFLFTVLLMLLVSVHLYGQKLEVQKSNYMIPKSYTGNVMTSKISLTGSEFWTGYWDGVVNDQTQQVGVQQTPMDYGCAICYPAGSATIANKTIAGIKVSFPDSKNIGELKVFISTALPKTAEDADVCWQSVTNITGIQNPDDPFNEVRFEKPYKVDSSKPVYIGYFFKVTGGNSNADKFPCLIQGGPDKKDALWLSFGGEAWADYNGNGFGVLAMQVLVSVEIEDNAAYISSEIGKVLATKDGYDLPLEVENAGNKGISSLTVVTDVNGIVTENEVKPEKTITGIGSKFAFKAHINTPDKTGSYDFSVKITRVNGVEIVNPYENKGKMLLISRIVDHKVFFEEFSAMWNGWEPRALVGMEKTKQLYGDSVIIVSAHGADALECKDYAKVLKTVAGYPSVHIDRTFMGIDPYYGKQDDGYSIGKEIKTCMSVVPVAEIEAKPSVHGNIVMANAEVTFLYSGDASDYAVGYILTEDGMTNSKWSQANNYSQFKGQGIEDAEPLFEPWVNGNSQVKNVIYDGIVIAAKGIETGVDGSIPVVVNEDVVVSHTEEFDLSLYNKIQNKDSMNLVVVLFDRTTGYVINADITKFSEKSGTEDLKYIEVDVKTPGTLGIEVLKQVNVLQNVSSLRVKGKLNDEDLAYLKKMTNIIACDLSQAEFDVLPDETFAYLNSLSSVKLPEGLRYIGYRAFYECGNLGELIMPNSVIKLGTYYNYSDGDSDTFYNCESLKKIVFSDSLEILPSSVAEYCSSLKNVHLPVNLKKIGNRCFYNNTSLADINIPNTLQEIGSDAFNSCAIDSIRLPLRLSNLGYNAFSGCKNLQYIELPSHIEYYNNNFSYCPLIQKIVCTSAIPPIVNEDPFYASNAKSNITLVVPSFAITNYKLDEYWYQFGQIVQGDDVDYWKVAGDLSLTNNIRMNGKPDIDLYYGGNLTIGGNAPFKASQMNFFVSDDNPCRLLNMCESLSADSVNTYYKVEMDRWYFFTPFYDVYVKDIEVSNDASYVFRYFNAKNRAEIGAGNSWQNVVDEKLVAGQGYIFHCNKDCIITFPAKKEVHSQVFEVNEKTIPLVINESSTMANKNWNYVANPYPCYYDIYYMDFTAPITVWTGNTYRALSIVDDQYVLRPMQSFFVQKPDAIESIKFNPTGKQISSTVDRASYAAPKFAGVNDTRYVFNLTIGKDDVEDRTRVVLNENRSLKYEMECDASKFMSMNTDMSQIYTLNNDSEKLSINERPELDGKVKLGFYVSKPGTYNISVEHADGEIFIYDNETKKESELTEEGFSFEAEESGIFENRFVLRFVPVYQDVTSISSASEGCTDISVENGTIIVRDSNNAEISLYTLSGSLLDKNKGLLKKTVGAGVYLVVVDGESYKVVVS